MPNEKPGEINTLLNIMAQLRDPETGCPWDVRQTMQSLTRYTIEEAYEVADAITQQRPDEICDELGDLLFQIVFYAQIAEEQGTFTFTSIVEAVCAKLVRRHPHVFAGKSIAESELNTQWEQIKQDEKASRQQSDTSLLDDVPRGLPALMYAQKIQKRCASVGFDWEEPQAVLDKVKEEVTEISDELCAEKVNQVALEEEIGDAFFALVNLSRHCNVDADSALRKASNKFVGRFKKVEQAALSQNKDLAGMTMTELENLWQQAKKSPVK
ncbi:nucleoside triphosphate pyrophosphohydrolase [Alteromonas ponticola]|uniref:Nucleoside triphosphate pyrophosphohydrolase n=1 Tax=Alteromonas ponticola TaxID=2720613 RepID=A0ABX1R457_9ALTE|nr:nucleoside triphosphate pyrophosphohydrolase [Alteromonas ponticola]NMH60436.1 nucleoside triphosphate pyrophosphohydrolase [Alteromonas ponticola]